MCKDDKVLISSDLTHQEEWIIGTVITAKTDEGDIFFGKEYQFKPAKN